MRFAAPVAAFVVCSTLPAPAQPPGRTATTIAALRASPVFFHGKQFAALASVVDSRGLYRLEPIGPASTPEATPDVSSKPMYVFWRDRPTRTEGELRGEFWILAGSPKATAGSHRSIFALCSRTSRRDDGRAAIKCSSS